MLPKPSERAERGLSQTAAARQGVKSPDFLNTSGTPVRCELGQLAPRTFEQHAREDAEDFEISALPPFGSFITDVSSISGPSEKMNFLARSRY